MVLLYGIYSVLVHKPLVKVLAERRSKTEGAIEKARADIAAAEARTAEYEQRLREARIAVLKKQEARRQQALQERAAAVAEARIKAQAQVEQARAGIEQDKAAAQLGLQAESARLAAEIIRIVLRPGAAPVLQVVADDTVAYSKKPSAFTIVLLVISFAQVGRAANRAKFSAISYLQSSDSSNGRTSLSQQLAKESAKPPAKMMNHNSSTLRRYSS